jgi:hypothetical protein
MNKTPTKNFLTTATGAPVSDNVNIQTALLLAISGLILGLEGQPRVAELIFGGTLVGVAAMFIGGAAVNRKSNRYVSEAK